MPTSMPISPTQTLRKRQQGFGPFSNKDPDLEQKGYGPFTGKNLDIEKQIELDSQVELDTEIEKITEYGIPKLNPNLYPQRYRGKIQNIQENVKQVYGKIKKGQPITFVNYPINSLEELAMLSKVYNHPFIENTHVFYVDKDNNIIQQRGWTLNRRGTTLDPGERYIQDEAEKMGADKVFFVHNHPSHEARFSQADRKSAEIAKEQLGGLYGGDVVIGSRQYGIIQPDIWGNLSIKDNIEYHIGSTWQEGQDEFFPNQVPNFSKVDKLANYAKDLRDNPSTTVAISNWDSRIIAITEYNNLEALSASELVNFLRRETKRWGGYYINVFQGKDIDLPIEAFIENTGNRRGVKYRDGIMSVWKNNSPILPPEKSPNRLKSDTLYGFPILRNYYEGRKDPHDQNVTETWKQRKNAYE